MHNFYICTNQISFILKDLHFDYFYLVIRSKPLGKQTLPLVYLKHRQKPSNYMWEEWYKFANENYMTHQTKLIAQNKREQETRDEQKRLADEMCMRLTEQFYLDYIFQM